ncbi:MAG: hypothetical protein ACRCXQ_05720 [Vagococcus fluvialis]
MPKFTNKIIKLGSTNDLRTLPYLNDYTAYLNGNTILYKKENLKNYIKKFLIIDTMSYLYLSPDSPSQFKLEMYGKNKLKLMSELIDDK